tara:strand:+ start:5062 stop:5337 length:276 start_codon:yes stop_codon:yes gene_type:complete
MYKIKAYSKRQAKKLNVSIKPSTLKGKKIAVFKNDKKITDIGAIGYGDYPTFLATKGKEFANKRRTAYKKRHQKNRTKVGSRGYYADKILW